MSAVAKRYAAALIACTSSPEETRAIEESVTWFEHVLRLEEAQHFFLDPTISPTIRRETLSKLFPEGGSKTALHFLYLLIDKGRLRYLSEILPEYRKLRDTLEGRIFITVYSALPLEGDQLLSIGALYQKKFGGTEHEIKNRIDETLLGGIVVEIGEIRIDHSLRRKLQSLYGLLSDDPLLKGV